MYGFPFSTSSSRQYIYIKKEYNHKVFCLFACGQALTMSIKQMLEHHAANTNTILLMHFAVRKCSPCMTAGSLNFQLCNLTHPSCQHPTESVLNFIDFISNQYLLWIKTREIRELEATAPSCSKKQKKQKNTHTEEDQEQEAIRTCKKKMVLKN